ncbi:methyl-accepting chemotaxis protein [Natrarchaeobaculum aegyptiacum]|uniref:methyl-accepting chemotaxis protein n=1 Tax=Natrarchaeobaculum aegyptiacum TaxID=745377 RepID=UPI001E3556A5|nr:methyl-accepting chemotaxis protein [Natrarchaeobaculum aegyptiacum]
MVTLVLLGVGYVTLGDVQASVEDETEETLQSAAEAEAAEIDSLLAGRNDEAARMSASRSVAEGDEDAMRAEFENYFEHASETTNAVHYVDLEAGVIELSTDTAREGEEIDSEVQTWAVDPDEFDGADDARAFEPYELGDENLIGFASPVDGQESHVVVITTDITERGQLLEAPVDGGAMEIYSTETGKLTTSPDTDSLLEQYRVLDELPELEDELDEPRMDAATIKHDLVEEESVVVATVPTEELDWAVTVLAPESTVYGTLDDVRQSIVLLLAITVVGFVLVGGLVSRDVNNSLGNVTEYAEEIERGNLEVEIDQSRTDEFGQLSGLFERIRDTLREQLDEVEQRAEEAERERERARESKEAAETAQAEAQQAKAEAETLSRHLEEKAADYRETIEAVADGDLTRRLDTASESQAMTEIGESLNQMLTDLETMVVDVQALASEVEAESAEMTVATREIEDSSTAVAESTEEISAGADRQNEQLATAATEMSDLSATIEEITSMSETVADQSAQAERMGQHGTEQADDAIQTMDAIESKATETVEEMAALREEVERISDVVELIDDIADETNLLAINASIEAATANANGDGFAVVASEVKSLAEETAEATTEVEGLIDAVETSTESVAADLEEMQSGVVEGRETIDETVETLEQIVDRIEETNSGIQTIDDATSDQAASAQEVAKTVDDVAAVSDQAAQEAQNVSAASEEQASAIQQIATSSESLSEQAADLQSQLARFETRADASAVAGGGDLVSTGDD